MPAAVIGCAVFLYLETFLLPCVPRAATGDQSIYLHDAARMLEGQTIYRDFDHFTFPGTSSLYFLLFKTFGVQEWIPQAMLIVLGTLIAWLSFQITRRLVSGATAWLPGIMFLTMPFTGYLDATHHWYSTLAATAALAMLIAERTPRRIGVAGGCWALATFFAQSQVLGVLGFAVYLTWEARRTAEPLRLWLKKELTLLSCYAATVIVLNVYFVVKAGFRNFFYNTVVFVVKYYPQDSFNTWRAYLRSKPPVQSWATSWPDMPAWVLITVLVPLIYILFFVRYRRQSPALPAPAWDRLMLVNITGLSMLLTVASAASYNRLYTVSLPALILLVWFLDLHSRGERFLLGGLWMLVLVLAVAKPVITQTRWRERLDLPSGRTAFFSKPSYEQCEWLGKRTEPGQYFFGDHFAGFALRLKNPGPVAFVRPTGYTRPEEVAKLVEGFEKQRVQFVSWYAGLDDELAGSNGDNLGLLRQEMSRHYHVAVTFANGQRIFERNP